MGGLYIVTYSWDQKLENYSIRSPYTDIYQFKYRLPFTNTYTDIWNGINLNYTYTCLIWLYYVYTWFELYLYLIYQLLEISWKYG